MSGHTKRKIRDIVLMALGVWFFLRGTMIMQFEHPMFQWFYSIGPMAKAMSNMGRTQTIYIFTCIFGVFLFVGSLMELAGFGHRGERGFVVGVGSAALYAMPIYPWLKVLKGIVCRNWDHPGIGSFLVMAVFILFLLLAAFVSGSMYQSAYDPGLYILAAGLLADVGFVVGGLLIWGLAGLIRALAVLAGTTFLVGSIVVLFLIALFMVL